MATNPKKTPRRVSRSKKDKAVDVSRTIVWDESDVTSDEDLRRDTFSPSRLRDLRRTYG